MDVKKRKLATAALLFALSNAPSAALAATIIDFEGDELFAPALTLDDLPDDRGITARNIEYFSPTRIKDGYADLKWQHVHVGVKDERRSPGFDNGIVSGSQAAYNFWGYAASFYSSTPFSLESAYVTKDWVDGFTRFNGYAGNTLKYTQDIYSTTTAPTLATFNWHNVNKIEFYGLPTSYGHSSSFIVLDNVTISPVPEPSSYAMMIMGLGFLSTMYRRKAARKTPAQS